jgi:hypothetical protein
MAQIDNLKEPRYGPEGLASLSLRLSPGGLQPCKIFMLRCKQPKQTADLPLLLWGAIMPPGLPR